MDKPAGGAAAKIENLVITGPDIRHFPIRNGAVVKRCAPVRAALEDVELIDFLGNHRNDLDGGCASANDADLFPLEIYAFMRPVIGMKGRAFEIIHTLQKRQGRL